MPKGIYQRKIKPEANCHKLCPVPGCEMKQWYGGYCQRHIRRLQRIGALELKVRPTIIERFWSKVDKNGPIPGYRPELGNCWVWTAGGDKGYGKFMVKNHEEVKAHRFSWEIANNKKIPDGLVVDHLCRVPACVRPDHLEPVTNTENLRRGIGNFVAIAARATHCKNGHKYPERPAPYCYPARRCEICYRIRPYMRVRRAAEFYGRKEA